jgi:hypothetical protein
MTHLSLVLSVALALASPGLAGQVRESPAPGEWRVFTGSWSAVGQRQTLPTEGDRLSGIVQLSGTVLLTGGEGLSRGFRGEAIGYDDGGSLSTGRAVWTDERGDRIFSVFKGEAVETGRRITGTITGGTGRYAGLTGEYTFTWQYVLAAEDTVIQGRTVNLEGRVRQSEARR